MFAALVAGIPILATLAATGQGGLGHFIVASVGVMVGVFAGSVACFFFAWMSVIQQGRTRVVLQWASVFCLSLLLVGVSMGASVLAWGCFDGWRTARTVAFCDTLIPVIESHRDERDEYPRGIARILSSRQQPRFTREITYSPEPHGYRIEIGDYFDYDDGGPTYRPDVGWRK